MHRKTGKIDLLRYVCAHDVGMIVNPETLKHVIDRQLVYGTSRAMFEEVRFDAEHGHQRRLADLSGAAHRPICRRRSRSC